MVWRNYVTVTLCMHAGSKIRNVGDTIMNANSYMWVATWDLTYDICVHVRSRSSEMYLWRPWPWFIPRPWCIAPHADVIAACPRLLLLLLSRDVFSAEFQLSQVVCKLTILLRAIRGLCVNPIMHLSFMSCLWYLAVTCTCYLVQSTQSLASPCAPQRALSCSPFD